MPFPSVEETEQQKKASIKQNKALLKYIRLHNSKDSLKDMQIVRFGNHSIIAIHRPSKKTPLNGDIGTVYPAYPIKRDGTIDKDTELKVKIIKDSGSILRNMADIQKKEEYDRIQKETLNDNTVFSTRMTIIPQLKKKKGKTVYEIMLLMSNVPGVRLDSLIAEGAFTENALTPEQRIYLAIQIVNFYIELHDKGVLHADVKAENFLIDLKTLRATGIDIAPYYTKSTAAPEIIASNGSEMSVQSDIYSIANDLLLPIFSGMRPEKDEQGNITKDEASFIEYEITKNFNTYSGCIRENSTSQTIINALWEMQACNPHDRISLQELKYKLEGCLCDIRQSHYIETDETELKQLEHQKQLRLLESILEQPEYEIHPDYIMDLTSKEVGASSKQESVNKHRFFSTPFRFLHKDASAHTAKLSV